MSRIATSSSGGSVNIQDTNGNAINASGGALNVNVVSGGATGTVINIYNEITSIAQGASGIIVTYTVPIGNTLSLSRVNVSSDSVSTIEVDFSGVASSKGRLSYSNFNLSFAYGSQNNGYSLAAGTVINVVGTNNSLLGVASFNANIQGVLN